MRQTDRLLYGKQTIYYTANKHIPKKNPNFAPVNRSPNPKRRHRPMRVILINTSERIGGAAIAANRLMEALKGQGIKAKMLVRDKQTQSSTVVALRQNWRMVGQFVWERVVIWAANRFSRQNLFAVDIANTGNDITALPEFQQADIVHLHWVNQGMLSLKDIRKILDSGKPVVWTMHDMWPCTGICHYARRCDHYRTACHNCPYLAGGRQNKDLSATTFRRPAAGGSRGRHAKAPCCKACPSPAFPTPSTPTSSVRTTRQRHAANYSCPRTCGSCSSAPSR